MFTHPLKNQRYNKDALQRIQLNLNKQKVLTQRIKSILPNGLDKHCLHVTLSDKKLTLYTDSSMWASKFLYLRKTIMSQGAQQINQPIQSFKVKVMATEKFTAPPVPLLKPSSGTLQNMSKGCSSIKDEKLKDSLTRLIATLKAQS